MKDELEYFVEKGTQEKIVVRKSKNKDIKARVYKGKNHYYLPEDLYEQYNEKIQDMLKEKKAREEQYNKETEEAVDKIFAQRRKNNNNAHYVNPNRKSPHQEHHAIEKKEIRRPNPSRQKKKMPKKYSGKKRTRLKAMLFAILIAGSIGEFAHIIDKNIEYENVAKEVQELTDDEIQDEIIDILKQEVSDATQESKEHIKLWHSHPDSELIRTEVIAGDVTYKAEQDLRSPINIGNTLKSKGITSIIEEATSARSRRDLIKTLMKARKFSEKKDLEVDGDELKEVKAEEDHER